MTNLRDELTAVAEVVGENGLLEAEVSSKEESLPPTIVDLDSITDDNQLEMLFDALDLEDRDGGDSEEEGENVRSTTKQLLIQYLVVTLTRMISLHARISRPET